MSEMSRRDFLRKSGTTFAVALGAAATDMLNIAPAFGANDRIVMGWIGCGGMGRNDYGLFSANPDVAFAALCDVDDSHLESAMALSGGKLQPYRDFRAVMERKDIDAVLIATPDHWHCLTTIAACESGKDVYVEKPLATSIGEGRAMVNAARRYGRVVQMGTQQRSGAHFQQVVQLIREGAIGEVTLARTWNCSNEAPDGMGLPEDGDPPAGVDYDMWLGPAPKRPFNPNRFHYSWRWFFDYANGMLGDWGVHLIDIVLWAMGVQAPISVCATGGKFAINDNRDTPDTMEVIYEFPGFIHTYSLRKGNEAPLDGKHGYGMQFHGTKGTLFVDREGWELIPEPESATEARKGGGSVQNEPHVRNFLDCVKSRKRPICDLEVGYRTTVTCILGNISYLTGRKLYWDAEAERITNDPAADRYLTRPYRAPWRL